LQKGILHQGKLYLSQHFVCFYSNILVSEAKLVLRADQITRVELAKVGLIFPTAIRITMRDGTEYLFASFLQREHAFTTLQRMARGERLGRQRVKTPKQLDVDMRILERGGTSSAAAAAAAAGNPSSKHQQLLDRRAERLRQAEEEQQGLEENDEEQPPPPRGSSRKPRSARTSHVPAAAVAAAASPAFSDEDDALSLFRKPGSSAAAVAPSSGQARAAAARRADDDFLELDPDDAGAEPLPRAANARRTAAKQRGGARQPPPAEEYEDMGGGAVDGEPPPQASSSARSSKKPGAAAGAGYGDLLVVPSAKRVSGPNAPNSAPGRSQNTAAAGAGHSRKHSGADGQDDSAAGSRKHSSAAASSSAAAASSRKTSAAAAESDSDDDEFGAGCSIFDPVPTYKTADARVTRISSRFRDLVHPLDARNRRLLHQGFVRRQGKLSAVDRWLFLFTDCLLFAKIVEPETGKTEERYEMKQEIDLVNMTVDARPAELQRADAPGTSAAFASGIDLLRSSRLPNVFRVNATTPEMASYVISVSTLQEKRVWLMRLQFAITRHMLTTGHPATTAPHNDGWWLKPVRGTLHGAAFEGDMVLLRALLKADPSSSYVNARLEYVAQKAMFAAPRPFCKQWVVGGALTFILFSLLQGSCVHCCVCVVCVCSCTFSFYRCPYCSFAGVESNPHPCSVVKARPSDIAASIIAPPPQQNGL
jgi:hypothetical protein